MSAREPFRLLLADRRTGRTTQAFNWVSHGVEVPGYYPGWSRVLLIPTMSMFEYHRRDWWARLEDYDHRVYQLGDWQRAQGVRHDTEVCIDDLEDAIGSVRLNMLPGRIVCATMYGAPWEDIEFSPAELARVTPD